MKKSRLQYLSSPTRVREKVGQPLRTSSSVEEAILLHDQSSSPSRIYNPPRRRISSSSSSSSKGKPLELPWLRKDKIVHQRLSRRNGSTQLPLLSSKINREDYEKLQRECQRLRRLLSERHSKDNSNTAMRQDNQSNNHNTNQTESVGGEDQQLVQFDLGMQFKSVERMLNSLDNVFVDTAREVRIRWDAALLLQTTIRKFVARNKFIRLREALHRFRKRHCVSLVNRIQHLRRRNRNNMERVRNMCAKRMMHTTRLVFKHWRREAAKSRPFVKAKLRDAMQLLSRRRERQLSVIFRAWSDISLGPNSAKAVRKRFEERFERTREHIRETRKKENLPSLVTKADVVREMEREAIQIVRSKHSRFTKMIFFAAWERTSLGKFRWNHKKARQFRFRVLVGRCFTSWAKYAVRVTTGLAPSDAAKPEVFYIGKHSEGRVVQHFRRATLRKHLR